MKGRPTEYTEEIIEQSWEYVNGGWKERSNTVPSVVGLCKYIGRGKSTVYDWAKDKEKVFSDILEAIMETQEEILTEKGLLKEFDSPLTKMFLTKHGYSDKQEIEQKTQHSFGKVSDEELERIVADSQD